MNATAQWIRVPGPFSSKVSVRWSNGNLERIKFGEAIRLFGTHVVQLALDRAGESVLVAPHKVQDGAK